MRSTRCLWLLAVALTLASCAPAGPVPPSLLPRAAEAIDPRLPVLPATTPRAADAALLGRLAALERQAETGNGQFLAAAARAEQLARNAAAVRSESWVVAQEALSAATAARSETTRALSEIDTIVAAALQSRGTIGPGDLAAVQSAARTVAALDQAQAARLRSIADQLGR